MADSSRIANAFGCLIMLILFALCGGCLYSCQREAQRQIDERKKRIAEEEALVNEYAPQLLPALQECQEQITAWNEDLSTLTQTFQRLGKDARKDKDVQEVAKVIEELNQVHAKLDDAKKQLIIALKKTQVKTGKGSQEEQLRRAQTLVAHAISESEKAVRIARARQRQIDGAIDRGELTGGESDQVLGQFDAPTGANHETEGTPRPTTPNPMPNNAPPSTERPSPAVSPEPSLTKSPADGSPIAKGANSQKTGTDPSSKEPRIPPRPSVPETPAEQVNSIGQRLKLIPAGQLEMGAERAEIDGLLANSRRLSEKAKERLLSELPRHGVTIPHAFYMSATEVTVGQFQKFVDDAGYVTTAETQSSPRNWRRVGYEQAENYPVTAVSWIDASVFCKWLSEKEQVTYRLPTEAEWEYACRAGSESSWFWGNDAKKLGEYAWSALDSGRKPRPVATKSPNKWGLFDMQGNVSEWCRDWYAAGYYASAPIDDPAGPESGEERVIRGGSVLLAEPGYFRSTLRGGARPTSELVGIGFRVVREAKP